MIYATFEDIQRRCRRTLTGEEEFCMSKVEDAAVIIDAYNKKASEEAKKLVTCNMVIRAIGDSDTSQIPIGANQGTISALGYSQTWSMSNGSARELYLSKTDKKILGSGAKIGFASSIESDGGET